jgi:hypothetical protein
MALSTDMSMTCCEERLLELEEVLLLTILQIKL